MKKKIAVFATGWATEIINNYIHGLYEGFKKISADIYVFAGFPTLGDSQEQLRGELNIFNLPDLNNFDAAYILANGIDFPDVQKSLNERGDSAGIPVIYTGKDDGIHYFVGADNYVGAKDLANHLITEHNVKEAFYIAGSSENEDSNARFKALSDALSEHGMSISADDIYYSNWEPKGTIYFLREWIDSGKKLPDAFVCANDSLAMVVCSEMRRIGKNVPDEIIVTGFDNEYLSSIYDPSISSVNQRFDLIGQAAADLAIRIFNGEEVERTTTIPCEFVPSESCGCKSARDFDSIRREIGRNKFLDAMNASVFNRSLAVMERQILGGRTYKVIKENIKIIIDTAFNYEGDCFHLLLDPLFEETTMDSSKSLRENGYPEKMDVILSMDEKQPVDIADFKTKDIVPYIKDKNKNHFFICMPLHDHGGSMGYMIFGDDLSKLEDTLKMQSYLDNMDNMLIKYKQTLSVDYLNRKLLELSETDALTHVKNRTAFEARKEQLDLDILNNKSMSFGVIVFDVNELKHINDSFSHEAGDAYIVNASRLICDTFKRSAIYRIGGDEFVVILTGSDYDARHELIESLKNKMEELKGQDIPLSEKVSLAGGLADYDHKKDDGVDSVIHRADVRMYRNKQAMKAGKP